MIERIFLYISLAVLICTGWFLGAESHIDYYVAYNEYIATVHKGIKVGNELLRRAHSAQDVFVLEVELYTLKKELSK